MEDPRGIGQKSFRPRYANPAASDSDDAACFERARMVVEDLLHDLNAHGGGNVG